MSEYSRGYEEKRNFIRMSISTPAILEFTDHTRYDVLCTNLSSGGAQLESSEAFPTETPATLTILSGGGSTADLVVDVNIVRCTPVENERYAIGVSIKKYH